MSDTEYTVEVGGMAGSGTVIASIPAKAVQDLAGHDSTASTSTDNSVTYTTPLQATISLAENQASTTNADTIYYIVNFTERVTDFDDADVTLAGTAKPTTAHVTCLDSPADGVGMIYNIAVSGMTQSDATKKDPLTQTDSVIVSLNSCARDDALNRANDPSNLAQVNYDVKRPTVTVDQATNQKDPTNESTINFTVVFSEPVTGFTSSELSLKDSDGKKLSTFVTGSGTTYDVAVTGMTENEPVVLTVPENVASDMAGNFNQASTSTDNSVTYDNVGPNVTINQSVTQSDPVEQDGAGDPANPKKIMFRVVFAEAVSDFGPSSVKLSGTAGATTAEVKQADADRKVFDVAVSGMKSDGTVIAELRAGMPTTMRAILASHRRAATTRCSSRRFRQSRSIRPSVRPIRRRSATPISAGSISRWYSASRLPISPRTTSRSTAQRQPAYCEHHCTRRRCLDLYRHRHWNYAQRRPHCHRPGRQGTRRSRPPERRRFDEHRQSRYLRRQRAFGHPPAADESNRRLAGQLHRYLCRAGQGLRGRQ